MAEPVNIDHGGGGRGVRLARAASRVRVDLALLVLDVVLVGLAYTAVLLVRLGIPIEGVWWHRFALFGPVACGIQVLATAICGGYGRSWRHAGIEEARRIVLAGFLTLAALLALFTWGGH